MANYLRHDPVTVKCDICQKEMHPRVYYVHKHDHILNDRLEKVLRSESPPVLGREFWQTVKARREHFAAQEEIRYQLWELQVQNSVEYVQALSKNMQESDAVEKSVDEIIKELQDLDFEKDKTIGGKNSKKSRKKGGGQGLSDKSVGETSEKEQMEKSLSEDEDEIIRRQSSREEPVTSISTSGEAHGCVSIHEDDSEAELARKEMVVCEILLDTLKQIYSCYLEALSVSINESAKGIKYLTSQLSLLSTDFAKGKSSASIQKIVTAGLDYAISDAPLRLTFLKFVVLNFASQLESGACYDIFNYIEDRTGKLDREGESWFPYFTFIESLSEMVSKKKEAEGIDEEEEKMVLELPSFVGQGSFEDGICQLYQKQSEYNQEIGDSSQVKFISKRKTGRDGEELAYEFFTKRLTHKFVTWMNDTKESGLPYDILLEENNNTEYIEVKATTDANKRWFYVTMKEYEHALAEGSSYIFARVVLSLSGELMSVTTYRNLAALLKSKKLQLVINHS